MPSTKCTPTVDIVLPLDREAFLDFLDQIGKKCPPPTVDIWSTCSSWPLVIHIYLNWLNSDSGREKILTPVRSNNPPFYLRIRQVLTFICTNIDFSTSAILLSYSNVLHCAECSLRHMPILHLLFQGYLSNEAGRNSIGIPHLHPPHYRPNTAVQRIFSLKNTKMCFRKVGN